MRLGLLSFSICFGLSLASPCFAADEAKDSLTHDLKQAVADSEKKLGALEPWQKQVFEDEITPNYNRFIKDYRHGSGGLNVVVDSDSIRRYLIFYGPKTLKTKDLRFLAYVYADPSCEKCTAALPEIRNQIRQRLERRGLIPVFLPKEDIPEQKRFGKALEDQLSTLISQRSAAGGVGVSWQPAPIDDIDTAHADEKRYLIHSYVQVKELSQNRGQLELMDSDSFETAASKLWTDSLTDVGSKIEIALSNNQSDPGKDGLLLEITGFKDFAQFMRVRNGLQNVFKDAGNLEDRRASKGRIVLAVVSSRSVDELKRLVSRYTGSPEMERNVRLEMRP